MASRGLTLRQIRYFIAVSEELHFGHAAAAQHVTQSALSQQIRQLEEILGVALLLRDRHGVQLTDAGAAFLREAKRIVTDVDRAVKIVQRSEATRRQLRIGFSPTTEWWFLPALIERLEAFGASDDYLWIRKLEEIGNDDLLAARFDAALTRHFQRCEGLDHEVLAWERPAVYLSTSDPLSRADELPLAALRDHRVRLLHRDLAPLQYETYRLHVEATNTDVHIDPTVGLARHLTAREIAAREYVLLGYSTAGAIFPTLAVVPLTSDTPGIPLTLVWRSDDERVQIRRLVAAAKEAANTGEFPPTVSRGPHLATHKPSSDAPRPHQR